MLRGVSGHQDLEESHLWNSSHFCHMRSTESDNTVTSGLALAVALSRSLPRSLSCVRASPAALLTIRGHRARGPERGRLRALHEIQEGAGAGEASGCREGSGVRFLHSIAFFRARLPRARVAPAVGGGGATAEG